MENIDGYEIRREDNVIKIKFIDIFGEGEEYVFDVDDASKIAMALMRAIAMPQ